MIYEGIVEDNQDPKKLGRCKVRIFGLHTENRGTGNRDRDYPVADLPWAEVGLPIFGGMDGAGVHGALELGTPVYVMFKDEDRQMPVVFAVSQKIMQQPPDTGFSDPSGEFPSADWYGEVNAASGVNMKYPPDFDSNKDSQSSAVEPSAYGSSDPYQNKVVQSKFHIIELDDTSGQERLHIYHKSGGFQEYHPDGVLVDKNTADRWTIVLGNHTILIDGDKDVHVTGNVTAKVDGNFTGEISGNFDATIGGTAKATISGQTDVNCSSVVNIKGSTINLN